MKETDRIVFDIETKNSFADVGGQENIEKLEVSVVCTYSYLRDEYQCFDEHEFAELGELLQSAHLLIGFSSKRFDIPVLKKHFNFNLSSIPHFDILEEVEKELGRRIGLGILAEANLGVGKTAHGLEAIEFYRKGEMEKLKKYCLQDVKITKGIYDLICTQKYFWIPRRNVPQMEKITFDYEEVKPSQNSLL